ncbi:hypothetical protein Tco_1329841 [Tanacetum coccineum]|uniref:Uncharacterized protein n=1 Tax=Tanacetum coccineum TaxID=301880 RepID=A0ABQ5D4J1_9ASTR
MKSWPLAISSPFLQSQMSSILFPCPSGCQLGQLDGLARSEYDELHLWAKDDDASRAFDITVGSRETGSVG